LDFDRFQPYRRALVSSNWHCYSKAIFADRSNSLHQTHNWLICMWWLSKEPILNGLPGVNDTKETAGSNPLRSTNEALRTASGRTSHDNVCGCNKSVPMRRETRLFVGWDRQFESPPLQQRVSANRRSLLAFSPLKRERCPAVFWPEIAARLLGERFSDRLHRSGPAETSNPLPRRSAELICAIAYLRSMRG
jgi:hypothetical protein